MKVLSSLCMAALFCATSFAQPAGVGDFLKRAKNGESLTVVFFGGSLTWGANASDPNRTSWRGRMMQKLRETYPNARWNFVDAAIGGTGSGLGVYRVDRDVLSKKPDFVFLDFTLNDGAKNTNDDALASYEAILRKLMDKNVTVFPVLLASREFVTLRDINELKRRTSHIEMFRQYRMSYADVIAGMRADYHSKRLNLDNVWPAELFDTVHPHDFGYEVYQQHIWKALQSAARDNLQPAVPETWFSKPTYANTVRYTLSSIRKLPKGWMVGYPETRAGTFDFLSSRWQDNEVIASNSKRLGFNKFQPMDIVPEKLSVRFYGTHVLLFGEATIWSGKFRVSVDGKVCGTYDDNAWALMFSPSAYMVKSIAKDLNPEQEHVLTIEPLFAGAMPQMIKLESVCIAGSKRAEIVK